MKAYRNPKLIRSLAAVVGGFALFTGTLPAAPFVFNSGDLLLAFRKSTAPRDLVVNIGKGTNYNALPPGVSLPITNLNLTLLHGAFSTFNGVQWSAAAANRPPFNTGYPEQTLWVTAPRLDPNVQSPPWVRSGEFQLAGAGSQIEQIGYNAAASSSAQSPSTSNTVTGVLIPVSSDFRLSTVIGSGNYDSTFQGNVETLTAGDFEDDSENVSRSDLYELQPGTTAGGTYLKPARYLGYFELKPDGSLTFNTSAPLPPAPTITQITRSGNVTTVSFTTVAGATYHLLATDASGLTTPRVSWTDVGSLPGDGNVNSLPDTNAADIRFYTVQVQP